jgi:Uma2 family endonuclease
MAQTLRAPIDVVDYFVFEDASPLRHEYVAGRVYAMAGGTMRHHRIAGNVFRLLAERIDDTACQVFMEGMKLHVQAADRVYYPDVFVFCGSAVAGDAKVAVDAALIVEVLSESTADIDRREKLEAYFRLPSLRAYWIVSQDEHRVEVHERDVDGQQRATAYGVGEAIPAGWLEGDPIALAGLYAGTDIARAP